MLGGGPAKPQIEHRAGWPGKVIALRTIAAVAAACLLWLAPALRTLPAAVEQHFGNLWMRMAACGAIGLGLFLLFWILLQLVAATVPNRASADHLLDDENPAEQPDPPASVTATHPVESAPAPPLILHDRPSRFVPSAIKAPAATVPPVPDLQNASPRDSRFRTRAHFSGQKRRASDYEGPRRRATDQTIKEAYSGPMRRAGDRQNSTRVSSTGESSERRIADRRSLPTQEAQHDARQHTVASPEPNSPSANVAPTSIHESVQSGRPDINRTPDPCDLAASYGPLPASLVRESGARTAQPFPRR